MGKLMHFGYMAKARSVNARMPVQMREERLTIHWFVTMIWVDTDMAASHKTKAQLHSTAQHSTLQQQCTSAHRQQLLYECEEQPCWWGCVWLFSLGHEALVDDGADSMAGGGLAGQAI